MSHSRFEILTRLSGIKEKQAEESVASVQQAMQAAERRARLLQAYERYVVPRAGPATVSGQALQAAAAFGIVTRKAEAQAEAQLARLRGDLAQALSKWAQARNADRVIATRRAQAEHQERQAAEARRAKLSPGLCPVVPQPTRGS